MKAISIMNIKAGLRSLLKIITVTFLLTTAIVSLHAQNCDPLIPNQSPNQACGSGSFNFSLATSGGDIVQATYTWYVSGPSGYTVIAGASGSNYQTPTLTSTGNYYVHVSYLHNACDPQDYYFVAPVVPPLSAPVAQNTTICGSGSATVSVTYQSNFTYDWYENASGAHLVPNVVGVLSTGEHYTLGGAGNSSLSIPTMSESLGFTVYATDLANTNCGASPTGATVRVVVNPLPSVSAGSSQTVCITGGNISLSGTPAGGTWSGTGTSGSSFNPLTSGPGSFDLSYTYTNPSTGCSATAHKQITVGPNVSLSNLSTCNSTISYQLAGASPSGGSWSGSFVNSTLGTFNPNQAGEGSHNVTYTYTDASSCVVSKTATVNVSSSSPAAFPYTVVSTSTCAPGGVQLSISAGGGGGDITNGGNVIYYQWYDNNDAPLVVSGQLVRGSSFNTPVLSSPQIYKVRAMNNSGCESAAAVAVADVRTVPGTPTLVSGNNCANGSGVVSINAVGGVTYQWADSQGTPIDPFVLRNGVTYQLSGSGNSTLSVSGISGTNDFTVLVYAVASSGPSCQSPPSIGTIFYRTLPTVSLGSNVPASFCLSNPSITLNGATPAGGVWSIDGNPASVLNPGTLNTGSHTVKYAFTDLYGCSNFAQQAVSITDPAPPFIQDKVIIYNASTTLTAGGAGTDESYRWYAQNGTTLLFEGYTFSTGNLTTSTSYKVTKYKTAQTTCESSVQSTLNVVVGPPNNYNYVRERVPQVAIQVEDVTSYPVEQANVHTTYFDGIGRPMQTIGTQLSPSKLDVVQPVVYDGIGREAKKYLSIAVDNTGYYKPNEQIIDPTTGNYIGIAQPFYSTGGTVASDTRPYAETVFEPSPLNRPSQQFGPGQDWKDNNKSVNHQYLLNNANEVLLFSYDATTGLVSTGAGSQAAYYAAGQLHATVTTDESGNDVVEYTDKLGHTVCKKVQYKTDSGTKLYASTYYIYDDLQNLVVVLPPEVIKSALSSLTGN